MRPFYRRYVFFRTFVFACAKWDEIPLPYAGIPFGIRGNAAPTTFIGRLRQCGALTHSLIVVRFVVDGGLNDGGLNDVLVVDVGDKTAGAEEPQRNPYTISSRIDKSPQAYIP